MPKANYRQIEAFNALMKSGSVTRAAELMFVSQPAVTKLLQAFEDDCGFALFDRATRRLQPTPEARQLFRETEKLETGVLRVRKVARAISKLERGEVSAVTFPGLSMQIMPRIAARRLRDAPDVRISLHMRTSRSIEDAMVTQVADFGISLLPTAHSSLHCESFARIAMVCALPRGHRLAERASVSLEDLVDERFVALGRDDLSFPIISESFQQAGIAMRPVAEVQMADAACAMVAAGHGVSIVPVLAMAGPRDPDLVFRALDQPLAMTAWKITSALGRLSQLAELLLDDLRRSLAELGSGDVRKAR